VTPEGRFTHCNPKIREILKISSDAEIGDYSISDYYKDKSEREKLLQKLREREAGGDFLEKQIITLVVEGKDIIVQDYCRTNVDRATRELIGYVGCLVDITEEEQYRRLFDGLPAGVYRLNERDEVIHVNRAVVNMLGYGDARELLGRPVQSVYANPGEVETLKNKALQEGGKVSGYIAELLKKNSESIFTSINTLCLYDAGGRYMGREGTISDVTVEERYRRILRDVPVGFYVVRTEDGADIIRHCNRQFAEIFEYENEEQILGMKIKELYSSDEAYPRFIVAIKDADLGNGPLLGYPLEAKTNKGNKIVIEVNSRLIHDQRKEIIGRMGVIRDITKEAGLRELVEEFTADIGRVLHTYSSSLTMLGNITKAVLQSLRPDPFGGRIPASPEDSVMELRSPVDKVVESLGHFLAQSTVLLALSEGRSETLSRALRIFDEYEKISILSFRIPALRQAALEVSALLGEMQKSKLPREVVRRVKQDVDDLLRVCAHCSLHQARHAILEMDHQVRSLRAYVLYRSRTKEPRLTCRAGHIINLSVKNIEEFAQDKNMEIRFQVKNPDVALLGTEGDLVRAFTNLLHNAVKYSWTLTNEQRPWITIKSVNDAEFIYISVQNHGVPIPLDEIAQGIIFQIGARGRLSSDRRRIGTGVGLADARKVARDHGGDVLIESHPAYKGGRNDDYTQPFITTATMKLPMNSLKEDQ